MEWGRDTSSLPLLLPMPNIAEVSTAAAIVSTIVWIIVGLGIAIAAIYLIKYITSKFSDSPSEANPNVDEQAAQDALIKMAQPESTPEEKAQALQDYFNTAHDPNPQGFFERLWSIF